MSAFVISRREDGKYQFTYASRKGKTVLTGLSCREKSDCELIIAKLQENLAAFSLTQKGNLKEKFVFRIVKDGLVLASSRKYSTELLLEKGIDQFLKHVTSAETLDFSNQDDIFAESE